MRLSRWGIAAVGPMVLGVFLVTLAPSRAAESTSSVTAPYEAANHSVERSCSNAIEQCAASSAADAHGGTLSVSAQADSGLGGTAPGSASAAAVSQLTQLVDIGPATAATFIFHVHVTRVTASSSDAGRAESHLWSTAQCDNCPPPYEQDAFPDRPGDVALSVTLVRGLNGGSQATLNIGAYADADVSCDDFCVLPRGSGRSSGSFRVTGIEIERWGLGTPSAPLISAPTRGSIVRPSTYQTTCDPGCESVQGEQIAGTAEPGMLVRVLDGSTLVGQAQADGSGKWSVYGSMPSGRHSLSVEASGPQGQAWSTTGPFTVAR